MSCGLPGRILVAGGGGGGSQDNYTPFGVGAGGGGGGVSGSSGFTGGGGQGIWGGGHGYGGAGGGPSSPGSGGGGGTGNGGGGNGTAGTSGSAGSGGTGGQGGSGYLGDNGAGGGGGGGGYFGGGGAGGGGGGGFLCDGGSGGGGGGGSGYIISTAIDPAYHTGVQQGNGQVSVTFKANTALTTTASVTGRTISDAAALTGGYSPTGTITFSLYGPGDTGCATLAATRYATVNGDGTYTSASYTATAPGTYTWEASYGGDGGNNPADEGCGVPSETVTLNQGSPTLSTQASLVGPPGTPVVVGQGIDDVATLSGGTAAPSGAIAFSLYGPGDTSCATPIATYSATVNGNGTYTTPAYTTTLAGTYRWVAGYSGDAFNDPVAPESCGLASETITVARAAPTLASTASGGSPTLDSPISDSATLAGGSSPTGSITFALYADDSCAGSPVLSSAAVPVSGDGTYSSGNLPAPDPGTYYWVATYSGDQNNSSVATSCGAGPITVQIVRA